MSPDSLATLVYTSGTTGRPKVGYHNDSVPLRNMHPYWKLNPCTLHMSTSPRSVGAPTALRRSADCNISSCAHGHPCPPWPQGVMLSHANIMSQLRNFHTLIKVHAGDTTLSLLPPWHIYERTTGYFIFQQGTTQVGCRGCIRTRVAWCAAQMQLRS
jgi:AMP-binding enzyme